MYWLPLGLFVGILWAQLDTVVIHSSNIVCQTCRRTIIRGLSTQKGIRFVEVDVPKKDIVVIYRADKTTVDKIRHAIARLGYDADTVSRDPAAFERLPICCRAPHSH
ncbi:MAG: heavy-metal-associated domain-containing protein [Bacteroidia bacterium]|nr:heavy-metal-associated domain-containing protein [Bacteroidia bacterium]MCX7764567.1 heavy-metal-associated domain-containing protein [Bacteroidia bacterium]MDW8058221.1 heavy-metal-associated domain-containing protein [Bacteroidia bacterium]